MFCQWRYILEQVERKFNALEAEVRQVRFIVNRPNRLSLVMLKEDGMAIKFAVVLPTPPVIEKDWNEIAFGELVVKIPGFDPLVIETTKDQQLTADRQVVDERFVGDQGALVELEFNYVDDAGNKGAIVTAAQELLDTVPPVAPDAIGLVATEEV